MHIGSFSDRVLIFGGPYSNLQATQAMRQAADELGIGAQQIICSGDLVAYCGRPEATVNAIRDWGIAVVMGNCEQSLALDQDDCGCGFDADSLCSTLAVDWYAFARSRVSRENKQWMQHLPRHVDFNLGGQHLRVIHGGSEQINQFIFYSSDRREKQSQLDQTQVDVIIGGHCGIPFGQKLGAQSWLNAGVIGLPANDGTPDGWFMLLQCAADNRLTASWHRLSYDHHGAARDMHNQALTRQYHDALLNGLWPSIDILPEHERSRRGQPLALADLTL